MQTAYQLQVDIYFHFTQCVLILYCMISAVCVLVIIRTISTKIVTDLLNIHLLFILFILEIIHYVVSVNLDYFSTSMKSKFSDKVMSTVLLSLFLYFFNELALNLFNMLNVYIDLISCSLLI